LSEQVGIPRRFRAERNEGLHRVLRGLPADFLVALVEGLERADQVVPGRLFAGETGGCAVGVTLRVVEPDFDGRGRRRWARKRSIAQLYRGVAKAIPHLRALEQVFDRSVRLYQAQRPELGKREAAKAVALWVAAEARTELLLRELDADWLRSLERRAAAAPAARAAPALA
jgi:hypothetical protein